jgi:hypothetical protein
MASSMVILRSSTVMPSSLARAMTEARVIPWQDGVPQLGSDQVTVFHHKEDVTAGAFFDVLVLLAVQEDGFHVARFFRFFFG